MNASFGERTGVFGEQTPLSVSERERSERTPRSEAERERSVTFGDRERECSETDSTGAFGDRTRTVNEHRIERNIEIGHLCDRASVLFAGLSFSESRGRLSYIHRAHGGE